MFDYDKELKKILTEDPLDILRLKITQTITIDQRLKESFEQINLFIDKNNNEPTETSNISERKLFSRLKQIKNDYEKVLILKSFDRHNLFQNVKEIKTVDDILDNDVLGLLDDDPENIFDIKNIPKNKAKADFVARRKPCKNFKDYENKFKEIQKDLSEGKRKLIHYKEPHLKEDRYYILDGILVYLEKIQEENIKVFEGKSGDKRNDPRTRCIFENGLESNMYLRSLGKELHINGSTIIHTNEEAFKEFNEGFASITHEDKATGNIYVLSSLSEKPEIKSIKNLYKIGYCTTSVEKRTENAENETTFLMAPVKIVSSYKTFNSNPQKLEDVIHQFFSERCLDIKIADKDGNYKKPKEWYIVPIKVIEHAIELIINRQIQNYKFDHLSNKITPLDKIK